jgi:DNA polymerase III sliding clamp (beta) subunit (PCNA family)
MKLQKVELANKIGKLKAIVPKKTPMEALQTVLVKDGYLIASDIELTVTVKLEGIREGSEEEFLIPESLFQFIGSLPAGDIEITQTPVEGYEGKKTNLKIKSGKIKNETQTIAADMFPAIKEMKEELTVATVDAEELKNGILHVLFAVGDQQAQKMMNCLCMDCKNGDLSFTGLDGHMVAWDKLPLEGEFKLLVPKRACQQILNLDLQGDVRVVTDKFTVRFETEYIKVETRLVDGDYFKTEKMFMEQPVTAAMNRKNLLDAVSRANILRTEGEAIVLDFIEDIMKISLVNSKNNFAEEIEMNEKVESEGLYIGLDPRLLAAALKAFDSENIYLNLADNKSPLKLLSDESDLKAVVLPVMIHR